MERERKNRVASVKTTRGSLTRSGMTGLGLLYNAPLNPRNMRRVLHLPGKGYTFYEEV